VTFLPIVVRELQVAARRRSTFQLRFFGATGATLLGGLFLMVSTLPGALAATGRGLFVALTVALLGMALISGVVLTADCLSRERREGTLGFLFLTDLTGWDVVAGKLVALALVPFQAVLAVFPVAAMSVFLGGVTYGEFWRVLLVVLLGLWMSLTVGLWVSSRVTDDRQAVAVSLLGMGALLGVPYLLGT
jgi:ABC-type transport system involved in multi-copper enzyme maturation permease subunit